MTLNFVIPELNIGGAGTPPLQFFKQGFALGGTGGSTPTWQDVILHGTTALTLINSKANSLEYLKLYGGLYQADTPTPTSPVDIVCNNGTLKLVDDELPNGYRRLLGYTCNDNVLWQITNFHLRGSDTVRISFSVSAACNVFGCYQGTSANDNYDLYASTSSGSKYLRYGSGTYLSYWSASNLDKRFDIVFTPTGTTGMPQDSTWSPLTFESANDLLLGATTFTGTSAKLKGDLYGNFIVDNRLKLIPCERLSDNSLGYYDTYSETFYEPTGTPTSMGYDVSHCEVIVDGTTENVQITNNGAVIGTATAADLFGIYNTARNYLDEQEVKTGHITRKTKAIVLTGYEDSWISSSTSYCYALKVDDCTANTSKVYCTHFQATNVNISNMPQYSVKTVLMSSSDTSGSIFFKTSSTYNNLTAFKNFLKAQVIAGTPVVCIYPLMSSKYETETVTPQNINIQAGNNTIEITQASIDGLELEVKYKAGVTVTVEEIEDAQLSNDVTVTIS